MSLVPKGDAGAFMQRLRDEYYGPLLAKGAVTEGGMGEVRMRTRACVHARSVGCVSGAGRWVC